MLWLELLVEDGVTGEAEVEGVFENACGEGLAN